MAKYIYKICSNEEWEEARKLNVFLGSKVDKRDGYIHFSSANQVHQTAKLHFSGKEGLTLLEINTNNLKKLKWQRSRNNELFPHLYGSLPLNAVVRKFNLVLDKNNNHIFPTWLNIL